MCFHWSDFYRLLVRDALKMDDAAIGSYMRVMNHFLWLLYVRAISGELAFSNDFSSIS